MKRARKLLVYLAAAALIAVAVLVYIEYRYQILFAAPRVSHEFLVDEHTTIRAVIQPDFGKDLIRRALGDQAPPDWALNALMPYEFATLAAPNPDVRVCRVSLFLNPRRLQPVLSDQSTSLRIPARTPFIQWESQRFESERKGVLLMSGAAEIDRRVTEFVLGRWGDVTVPDRMYLEGGHFLELLADNRDGSLFTILGLLDAHGVISLAAANLDYAGVAKHLVHISKLSLVGDVEGADALSLHLRIDCSPLASETDVTGLNNLLTFGTGYATGLLRDRYGLELEGRTETDGLTIHGQFRLGGIAGLLR